MLERWLPRLDLLALWLLGTCTGAIADEVLASHLGLSPVLANPLRGPHAFGPGDGLGWFALGAALPATLAVGRTGPGLSALPGWALALVAPLAGVAMTWRWGRDERCGWIAPPALFAALVLPVLERRRAAASWRAAWCMTLIVGVLFFLDDPGHRIARGSYPRAVVWWIGLAACGASTSAPLWRSGLRLTAVALSAFWGCAFWSLLANARQISKHSVGLQGVTLRAGEWHRHLGPPHHQLGAIDFMWPSLPALALLVLALRFGPNAADVVVGSLRARLATSSEHPRTAWARTRPRARMGVGALPPPRPSPDVVLGDRSVDV